MTFLKSIYTLKSISFFMLPSFVIGLDLLLNSSTFSNRMLWSSAASLVALLPLIIFSLKNLIVLNCWKSYMSLFISYFKLFLLNFYSHPVISSNSCLISLVRVSFGKCPSVDLRSIEILVTFLWFDNFWSSNLFLPWSPIVFICFFKAFPEREWIELSFSYILLWSEGSICSPVRN